jgi:hypothetical protein
MTELAEAAAAERKQRQLVASYLSHLASGSARLIAFQRQLAVDTGCPEAIADNGGVDTAVLIEHLRVTGHRFWHVRRNDDHTGFIVPDEPPEDPRIEKLEALIARPGTPGEGAAAEAALERITAGSAP